MLKTICTAKLHGATVTEANIHYTGSLTVDARLMKAAGLVPYEQVHVVDITNGARLVTYCIEGEPGSGTMCVNGAAARLVSAGDKIIVLSYAQLSPEELRAFRPTIVMLDERNRVREVIHERCRLSEEGGVEGEIGVGRPPRPTLRSHPDGGCSAIRPN